MIMKLYGPNHPETSPSVASKDLLHPFPPRHVTKKNSPSMMVSHVQRTGYFGVWKFSQIAQICRKFWHLWLQNMSPVGRHSWCHGARITWKTRTANAGTMAAWCRKLLQIPKTSKVWALLVLNQTVRDQEIPSAYVKHSYTWLLKMILEIDEIVDVPIENGDFPQLC